MTGDWSALKQAAENAPKGEWRQRCDTPWGSKVFFVGDGVPEIHLGATCEATRPTEAWKESAKATARERAAAANAACHFIASADPSTVLALVAENEELRAEKPNRMDRLQTDVGAWHRRAFPREHPLELALCAVEELGELSEALDDAATARLLSRNVTGLARALLKESHGANDRRAGVDWEAKVYDEIGDVLIVLASIADRRGWSLTDCLLGRYAFVSARYPGPEPEVIVGDVPGLTDANPNDANVAPQPEVQP